MLVIETYYLIDFENVHEEGLEGCRNLGQTDYIVIFFTQNARNLNMSDISNHGSSKVEMIEVPAGKQSADMHIVSYLGYLAGLKGSNCKVVIVSKDTDFDKVIKFWKEQKGISVSRAAQIKKQPTPKQSTQKAATSKQPTSKQKLNNDLSLELMKAMDLEGYKTTVGNKVVEIVEDLKGSEHLLADVHNALRGEYTNYLEVYATIKPVLSKYTDDKPPQSKDSTIAPEKRTKINSEIQKALSKAKLSNDIINYVASMAVKNLGVQNGKQQTYRDLLAKYGQKKGLDIYNRIKKIIG